MTTETAVYRELLRERYQELERILEDLPDPALVWQPSQDSPWRGPFNPLGFIVAHAISSTVYLLRRAEWTAGRREWRDVDGDEGAEEFGPANRRVAYLQERVWRTFGLADAILSSLSAADLEARWSHPTIPERSYSVRYDIVHAIEHLSEHIGQAQLTRQLWAKINET